MNIFTEISLILVIAAGVAGVMHILRQPLIIGHIITGLIVGPRLLNILSANEVIDVFSEIGIALLLFIVGLGLNPKLIKEVGGISLIAGLGQIVFTSVPGFLIARLLGFSYVSALYISVALAFSSTIIIVKLLSDKNDLQKLYGKIALGFLLVQDVIATLMLIVVSALGAGGDISELVGTIVVQGIALAALSVFAGIYILPRLSAFFAQSQEFLFLFAVAWGFGWAALFYVFGFSIEIGALIAGVTLSLSPYNLEITAKLRPLRDFFIILFFIMLGSNMNLNNFSAIVLPAVIFSLFVLIGNPLVVMILMGIFKYSKRTGFLAGLTVAQISEFSLILVILGIKVGHINETILSLVTIVGLLTIAGSTYLILYAEKIYAALAPWLSVFERRRARDRENTADSYDIILFGHNRIGYDFIRSFKKIQKTFLVIDFDPRMIAYLNERRIPCRYGDADDMEFLESLNLAKTQLIVSTIPDADTNLLLIKTIRAVNRRAIVIVIAHNIASAQTFYEAGATYVILPHFLGGEHAAAMVARYGTKKTAYAVEQRRHQAYIRERQRIGHDHPRHE